MNETFMIFFLIGMVGCGVVGGLIGSSRGRIAEGFLLGLFLGIIGWVVAWMMDDVRLKCPACRSVVSVSATKCSHCGSDLLVRT